jgi:hypothetical protein
VTRKSEKWEYRRIVGLIRKRVDASSCNTKEIIAYMRREFDHDPQPHEMERALMRCPRIHRVGSVEVDGEPVSVWASEWGPEFDGGMTKVRHD